MSPRILQTLTLAVLAAWTLGARAAVVNRFVSADGTWKKDGLKGVCYADDRAGNKSALQAAIDASSSGDTVWVKNDYVCDFGGAIGSDRYGQCSNRVNLANMTIVLRGEDDDWRNGPIIRGCHDRDNENGIGPNSMRALFVRQNPATIIGLQLLDGSNKSTSTQACDSGGCFADYSIQGVATVSNCLIAGGAAYLGGGASSGLFYNCVFSNNYAATQGGAGYYTSMTDCLVISNRAPTISANFSEYKHGTTTFQNHATRCRFLWNVSTGLDSEGAVRTTLLKNCHFEGNSAGGSGAAAVECTSYNCTFVRNMRRYDNESQNRGGAVNKGVHYNALIAYNTTAAYGAAYGGSYYNCTLYSNTNTLQHERIKCAGFGAVDLAVNCISYGNVGADDGVTLASNSCVQVSDVSAAKYVDCFNENPKFADIAAVDFTSQNRKYRDSGLAFDWMTDSEDVRSKDLPGHARIIGAGPDLGAYERVKPGVLLFLR